MKKQLKNKKYSLFEAHSLHDAKLRMKHEIGYLEYKLEDKYKNLGLHKTYMVKTYGCQGNIADSEKIKGIMEEMGYTEVEREEESDVLFFNTCAIRENAENRIYGELGRLHPLKVNNPNMIIALCGCMPQEEVTVEKIKEKYPQVDIVFGTHNIYQIPKYLYETYDNKHRVVEVYSYEGDIVEGIPLKRDSNHKAWVDIMYGCDEFCTYCIVPYTRGRERSRESSQIIKEVEDLVKKGYTEVTLLGQNVNAYGKDFKDKKYGFANLLEDLAKTGIPRIRYTTSHPRDLDKETIDVMAKYKNIMPHLHLPVQSGSNEILKKMNRKYTKEVYLEKVAYLKKMIPDISLTTDIIVAFPGETEEDFEATLDLVKKAEFEGAYTFIYSKRKGTPAATYENQVDPFTAKKRLLTLNKLINEGFARGNLRFEGCDLDVLVEGYSDSKEHLLSGYTENNKLVNFEGREDLIGKVVKVHITKAFTWHLRGEIIK